MIKEPAIVENTSPVAIANLTHAVGCGWCVRMRLNDEDNAIPPS